MTSDWEIFTTLDKSMTSRITLGDETICEAQRKGIVKLNSLGLSYIKNALYVPNLNSNLLNVGQFLSDGYSLVFEDSTCYVFKDKTKNNLLVEVPMAKK